MHITEKIDYILEESKQRIDESGLRNIKNLAKTHKEAEILYHQDTDGVCSAIAMKTYLEGYGINVTDAHMINYGDMEYSAPKPTPGKLIALVDFAHSKGTSVQIHTDHHDRQVGVDKKTSTSFVHAASNTEYLSTIIPKSDSFPTEDLKVISMVDSADYAKNDITPDDVMRAAFGVNKNISVEKNRTYMGLVVNKLLLAYKNKKGFLDQLVLMSKPSLVSMYVTIKYLAKKEGYRSPEELQTAMDKYVDVQKGLSSTNGKLSDIKSMKAGQNIEFGPIVVQYGSSMLTKPTVLYDRYTVFKNHSTSRYLVMVWPMGLIQVSQNPFNKTPNPYDLGELFQEVLKKYESKLKAIHVTLDYIKWSFEKKVVDDSMGFGMNDFIALFKEVAVGLEGSERWQNMLSDIVNKPNNKLTRKQTDIMKKVYVTGWDVIQAQSGGHKSISNCSGLSLLGKGYKEIMMDIVEDVVKELDKRVNG
jgi:hypothetical protein